MAALTVAENTKTSNLLRSQIKSSPIKADIWHLRCEEKELLELREALIEIQTIPPSTLALVLEEIDEICKAHI